MITHIKGNLIQMAISGHFDAIVHGCNCFSLQKSGIAKAMVDEFATDTFPMEHPHWYKGAEYMKLGNIDWREIYLSHIPKTLYVINAYTQYKPGVPGKYGIPFEYDHFATCLDKINFLFKGKKIGLPHIGAGLAKGNWNQILKIITQKLTNVDVVVVEFDNL